MHLSNRLKTAAGLVTPKGRVADVGCDHAYLSIYLIRQGIAGHMIAMDINEGPLARARENIKLYGLTKQQVDTRLSDGLEALQDGECDTIFIAGMGGRLMIHILEGKPDLVKQVQELVLSPQSEVCLVRRYLTSVGFEITDERMVKEEGKYYIIIKASNLYGKQGKEYTPFGYLYGPILLERKDPCLWDFLEHQRHKYSRIIEQMERNAKKESQKRFCEIKEEYHHILNAQEYFI